MSNVIGQAVIEITADGRKFSQELQSKTQPALSKISGQMKTIGNDFQEFGGLLTKAITVPAIAAAGAVAGIALASGWKRLVSIDTARGQMQGLGFDADAVMKQVDKGVTNTSLSMQQGANVAVAALSTNNIALGDVEDQIKRVANVSAAYGIEADHAGRLLNNVLVKNKVTWGDLSQMQSNNIPIVSLLADHYGVTGDAIQDMASKGLISIDDLNTALDTGAGAAAEAYANTWEGVMANIWANVSKLGAAMLEGVFPQIKAEAEKFLAILKSPEAMAAAQRIGQVLGDVFAVVLDILKRLVSGFLNLPGPVQKFIGVLALIAVALGPVISTVGSFLLSLTTIINFVSTYVIPVLGFLGGALKSLWAVLLANPITLVIAAIAAVVAALVWFFTQTEIGRELWGNFVQWLKDIWQGLTEWFTGSFLPAMQGVWESITEGWQSLVEWASSVGDGIAAAWEWLSERTSAIWDSIMNVLRSFGEWISTHFGPIFTALGDLFAAIGELIVSIWQGVWDFFVNIWNATGQPVIDMIGVALQAVGQWFQEVWQNVVNGWNAVGAPIFEAIKQVFVMLYETVVTIFTGIVEVITSYFTTVWTIISTIVTSIWEVIVTVFTGIWQTITTVVQGIWQTISSVFTMIGQFFVAIWNAIKATVEAALAFIASIIRGVTQAIRGDWTGAWNTIKNAFSTVWNAIRSITTTFTNAIRVAITGFLNAVKSIWTSVWNSVRSIFSSVWNGIRSIVTSMVSTIRNAISSFLSSVRSSWSSGWNAVRNLTSNVINSVRNVIRNGLNNVVNFIRTIPSRIWGIFSNIGSLLLSAGSSLVNGFLRGVQNAWGRLTGWIKNGIARIRNMFPFSPAKEGPFSGKGYTLYSGQALIQDFAKGIKDQERGMVQTVARAAKHAQDAFRVDSMVPTMGAKELLQLGRIRHITAPKVPAERGSFDDQSQYRNQPPEGGGDIIQVIVPKGRDRVAVLQGLESGRFRSRTRRR